MAQAPNAILAINSLDRFNFQGETLFNNTIVNSLYFKIFDGPPFSNNFQIESGGALIYGYMNKIIISQIQLQYNVPTIIPGKNDYLLLFQAGTFPGIAIAIVIIPYGFYTPQELAAVLQVLIRATDFGLGGNAPDFTVIYDAEQNAFVFDSNNPSFLFYFPVDLATIQVVIPGITPSFIPLLKTYNLLGISQANADDFLGPGKQVQKSGNNINWLYTPYVDIISEALTKYQNMKDTDTSRNKLNSIIARIYLVGVGPAQAVDGNPVGSRPFTVIQDMNSSKVIRWSVNEAVNNLDFQMRDQYGDLLFVSGQSSDVGFPLVGYFSSEFQMT